MSLFLGLASLAGGLLQRSSEKKSAKAANARADAAAAADRDNTIRDRENMFVDLRASAKKGGFNPLTALQMTGGAGFGSGSSASGVSGFYQAPSFASTKTIIDGFMGVGEALTSSAAHKRTVKDATKDAVVFGAIDQQPMNRILGDNRGLKVRSMNDIHSATRYSEPPMSSPRPRVPPSNAQALADGDFDEGHVNVIEETMTDSGNIIRVPMGPDFDEMVTGFAINKYGQAKTVARTYREAWTPAFQRFDRVTGDFSRAVDETAQKFASNLTGGYTFGQQNPLSSGYQPLPTWQDRATNPLRRN